MRNLSASKGNPMIASTDIDIERACKPNCHCPLAARARGGGQHVGSGCHGVKVTYKPTGESVTCLGERSQHANRLKAIADLTKLIEDRDRLDILPDGTLAVECARCNATGTVGDEWCAACGGAQMGWFDCRTLVDNITIGAALCRSFRAGWIVSHMWPREDATSDVMMVETAIYDGSSMVWRPGCGRAIVEVGR